jgi:hypothetical protein
VCGRDLGRRKTVAVSHRDCQQATPSTSQAVQTVTAAVPHTQPTWESDDFSGTTRGNLSFNTSFTHERKKHGNILHSVLGFSVSGMNGS